MTFHTSGFYESQDAAGSAVNIAAVADQRLFVQGDDLRVPQLNQVIMVAAGIAANATIGARLTSPSLDELVNLRVRPYNGGNDGDVEPDAVPAVLDFIQNPLRLAVDEILQAETDANPTAAAAEWVFCWFADGPVSPATGQRVFTVRGTNTSALTADVLTARTLTLDENIPSGQYDIVGMRSQATGLVMARLIMQGGGAWRPGTLGFDDDQDLDVPGSRYGGWGVWGTFPFTQVPQVEYLSISADTDMETFLDLVRRSS